ncbi:MAG: hypothetical protein LBC18_09110 [Opitutaceae bacterium]|nr:hypothetical protein [Opitutaceae bacterium]
MVDGFVDGWFVDWSGETVRSFYLSLYSFSSSFLFIFILSSFSLSSSSPGTPFAWALLALRSACKRVAGEAKEKDKEKE